jgi:hypothetical protein
LPDALLQGISVDKEPHSDPIESVAWIKEVITSPWLWKLQWTTLVMLFVSPMLRDILVAHCPEPVAKKWLQPLETRLHVKLLGASTNEDRPGATAAKTPLVTVTSELILLRTTYEL